MLTTVYCTYFVVNNLNIRVESQYVQHFQSMPKNILSNVVNRVAAQTATLHFSRCALALSGVAKRYIYMQSITSVVYVT